MEQDLEREISKQDPETIFADFKKALKLLEVVGPNPLLIGSAEYWDRYYKLVDKYYEEEE